MTSNKALRRQHRQRRLLVVVVLLGGLAAILALFGPGLLNGLRTQDGPLPWRAECVVETPDGKVGLSRDQAKLATTAVALMARGLVAPDTSGIEGAVLQQLSDGPSGDAGPSLACRGSAAADLTVEEISATGLTPRAEQLRAAMEEVFGRQSLGGFAPGGVDQGHGTDSTHYDGRAIDIFFRPVSEENRRQGWILAHWLVAHAEELNIQYVIFDDRFWSARSSRAQWRDYDAPDPVNEILRHLDHVHVDVLGGSPG